MQEQLPGTTSIELLRRMLVIRHTEEAIAERYTAGKMRCPTHLCTGQEAVAAAAGLALRKDDFAVSTHRAHGHYLGKGGDLKRMLAEIHGKSTGCSSGKGGSMHLIDQEVGFMGCTAIVGGTIPIGVGLGFSISLKKTNQVSCIFLGDGAIEEGVFYESVNFAVLKKLPVLFVCENNLYSVYSPLRVRQPANRKIFEMVRSFGCPAEAGDGNEATGVYSALSAAISTIRKGTGPFFFEFSTYRWREHCGPFFDNDIGYRTEEEYRGWKENDPVCRLESELLKSSIITEQARKDLHQEVLSKVKAAFEFAETSPFPDESETPLHVFSQLEA